MNEELINEATTLGLVKALLENKQRYVEIYESRWWHVRNRWRKRHRLKALSQNSQAIAHELSTRFRGILWQMARRVKSGPLTATEWKNCQTSIWQLVNDHARTMSNYLRFCGVLWDICSGEFGKLGNISSLTALKTKFMLRQFVDEMSNSDARGLLRASAFGEKEETMPEGKELMDGVNRAIPVLHMHLLSRIDDLSALTDGEITADMVRRFKEPFLEYKRWLFES